MPKLQLLAIPVAAVVLIGALIAGVFLLSPAGAPAASATPVVATSARPDPSAPAAAPSGAPQASAGATAAPAGPVASDAAPAPTCLTGIPSTPEELAAGDGDSCYFISGYVNHDSSVAEAAVILARYVAAAGEAEPAVTEFRATSDANGFYRLAVTPDARWRVMVEIDGVAKLIPVESVSGGGSSAADAVFNIGRDSRVVLNISLLSVDDGVRIIGRHELIPLEIVATPEPEPEYNALDKAATDASTLVFRTELIERLQRIERAQRNADFLSLLNLFVGSLAVIGIAIFVYKLLGSPHSLTVALNKRAK